MIDYKQIQEVIESDRFKEAVKLQVNKIIQQRHNRPKPKPGTRYPKNVVDSLMDRELLTVHYFLENIGDVWMKRSKLPARERWLIDMVCVVAFKQSLTNDSI